MLEVGAIVAGKYRIERILGMGGMGVVAVATHVQLDQQFALKVVHDAMAEDPSIVERFMREARASARLRSEHVCRVSDVDQLDSGAPFIVMELLDGMDLQKVLQAAILPIETAASYVLQACVAIAEAHGVGIVHRDLKPANLFLTTRMDGTPLIKVLDFGIAKATADADLHITQTQAIMGSPGYMSPEQLRSARDVDARSDIWSLGVILYELATGTLPFVAQTITELAVKVSIDPFAPLPAAMDARFAAIIARCLEKDVARRYPSVLDLANDLAPFAGAAGDHAAQLIARLSGSQPKISAPRTIQPHSPSGVLRAAPTHRSAIVASAATVAAPSRSPRRPVMIVGALLVLAGAALGGYVLTRRSEPGRAAKHVHRDAGAHDAAAPPDAAAPDAAAPIDAGMDFETRTLEGLRAEKKWTDIIDLGKTAAPGDTELVAAAAAARTAYTTETLARIDAAAKAGACDQARAIAAAASHYVDPAPLATAASRCVAKKPPPPAPPPDEPLTAEKIKELVVAGDRALHDKRFEDALAIAKKALADTHHAHVGAARVAAIASCQLGRAKDAQAYADLIPRGGPRNTSVRMAVIRACDTKRIEIQ